MKNTPVGGLPWRQVYNPRWEDIRVGDATDYRNDRPGHAIVVIEKADGCFIELNKVFAE